MPSPPPSAPPHSPSPVPAHLLAFADLPVGVSLLGRHVKVLRRGLNYTHHGILSSESGDMVIHYAKDSGGLSSAFSGVIREEPFSAFLYDSDPADVELVELEADEQEEHGEHAFEQEEVARRARHCIGLSDYSLWGANCEAFAHWCVTGRHYSKQVRKQADWCKSLGLFAGIASVLAFTTSAILMRSSGAQIRRSR